MMTNRISKKIKINKAVPTLVIGGWEVDLVTYACYWDRQLHGIFQVPADFTVSIESMSAFFEGPDRERFLSALQGSASQGTPFHLDLALTTPQKHLKWVRIHGNPVRTTPASFRLFGTIQDITTQKVFEYAAPERAEDHLATTGRIKEAVLLVPDESVAGVTKPAVGRVFSRDAPQPDDAREKVAEQQNLLKALLQHSSDMGCLLDTQGNYRYVGPSVKPLLGYEADFLVGKNAFSFIHPDDSRRVRSQLGPLAPFQPVQIAPFRFRDSQGHWRWLETTVTNLLADPTVKALVANSRDITARKVQEAQLLESWQQQQQTLGEVQKIMKHSLDVICSIDAEGRFIWLSDACQTVWGYTPGELVEKHYIDLVFPVDRPKTRQAAADIMAGVAMTNFENRYICQDGSWRPMVWSAFWFEAEQVMFCVARDATEKKRGEEDMARIQMAVNHAADAISIADKTGKSIYHNQAFTTLLGYSPEQLNLLEDATALFVDRALGHHIDRTIHQGRSWSGDVQCYDRHRNILDFSLRADAIIDDQGNKIGLIGLWTDIRQRKKAEAEQKALIGELIRHNHDLQQFSFITSHNLRAPVANLMGLMGLYNKEDPSHPDNGELIEGFEGAIQQLDSTLSDLIQILVIKNNVHIGKEPLALEPLFQGVYHSIELAARESQALLTCDFSQAPGLVYNRVHLESIFLNLLTNAIRYRSPKRPLEIRITSKTSGDYLEIDFEDNGLGIDLARYKNRLFGLYQRFHEHSESKGLGLYIIKSQVTALGGDIEVESEVDKGTTFKVFLKLE